MNELSSLAQRDADAYGKVSAAYKLPGEGDEAARTKAAAVRDALLGAADVPLETARACAKVAELAARVAEQGNQNAVSDAGVAALLADAACRGAAYNVRINVAALENRADGAPLVDEAKRLVAQTAELAKRATDRVEAAIG